MKTCDLLSYTEDKSERNKEYVEVQHTQNGRIRVQHEGKEVTVPPPFSRLGLTIEHPSCAQEIEQEEYTKFYAARLCGVEHASGFKIPFAAGPTH